jgi:hypothetical protein
LMLLSAAARHIFIVSGRRNNFLVSE